MSKEAEFSFFVKKYTEILFIIKLVFGKHRNRKILIRNMNFYALKIVHHRQFESYMCDISIKRSET